MPDTELDWTFESIPAEGEAAPAAWRRPAVPRPEPPPARPARRWRGWLLGALLSGVLAAAAGLWLFTALGWQRVERQIAQRVLQEDEQSLARQSAAVDAMQWPGDPAWQAARHAEAELGLPAYPPADNLLPSGQPPRVIEVVTLTTDEVAATVLRSFTDAAGQSYEFEYVQRYRGTGAGGWQRLAPQVAHHETTLWQGRRLSVTLPTADLPWLRPLLPQVDAYLIQACADWECPNELVAPLLFTNRLAELPGLVAARRPAASAEPPAYPITFDLIFRYPSYPRRVVLAAPELAGRPHDAAAQAALLRSITANLLAYVGGEVARSPRSGNGHFLDALIAREEIRLGLSTRAAWPVTPSTYQPPEALWPFRRIAETTPARRPNIAARLQALAFLDFALGDSWPSADAALLRTLRSQPRLHDWLGQTLGLDGAEIEARWLDRAAQALAAQAPARWHELEGLAAVCDSGAWMVRGGEPVPLPLQPYAWLPPDAVSPDGTYLAVVESPSSALAQIRVIHLGNLVSAVVEAEGLNLPLGWSPAGELLYLTHSGGPFSPIFANELRLYQPDTGQVVTLGARALITPWGHAPSWSADHRLLAITLVATAGPTRGQVAVSPGIVALTPPLQTLRLPVEGYGAALSPDGQQLAYVSGSLSLEAGQAPGARLTLMTPATQATRDLLPDETAGRFHNPKALRWSPDGRRLAFVDEQPGGEATLYLATFAAGQAGGSADLQVLRSGVNQFNWAEFSADSRYLAAQHHNFMRGEVVVFDLLTGRTVTYAGGDAARPWSPEGHRLAMAGPGGLYVVDPASGDEQWLRPGVCRPAWLALP